MSRRTQWLFAAGSVCLGAFLFFVSERGQKILIGPIPQHVTGPELDDRLMGAALAPWVYLLAPAIFLLACTMFSWWRDKKAAKAKTFSEMGVDQRSS